MLYYENNPRHKTHTYAFLQGEIFKDIISIFYYIWKIVGCRRDGDYMHGCDKVTKRFVRLDQLSTKRMLTFSNFSTDLGTVPVVGL